MVTNAGSDLEQPIPRRRRLYRRARRVLLVVVAVLALSVTILAVGSLASLDWDRRHAAATGELPLLGDTEAELVRIAANGFEFRARIRGVGEPAGVRDGVLLLHGFPQTSASFQPLADALAELGHPVVAFDQRGYSPGARPPGRAPYAIVHLVRDVTAIADAAGFERFHLVGHDWGAVVAWATALRNPKRVRSLTALSVPHPSAFLEAVESDPDQRARSRYFALFRAPLLPESLFSFGGQAVLRDMYAVMPPEHAEEYLAVFAEPGAMTAALNWYRSMPGDLEELRDDPAVVVPVLFIRGNDDMAVGRAGVVGQRRLMPEDYTEIELDASHWLLEDAGERVVAEVLAHVSAH